MNCSAAKRKISAYIDNAPDNDPQGEVALHLNACKNCRRYQEELSTLRQMMMPPDAIKPSPYFILKIKHKIELFEREKTPTSIGTGMRWLPAIATGFVAGIALFAGSFFGNTLWTHITQQSGPDTQIVSAAELNVFDDSPDGSITAVYNNEV
jgi:predicted anti-sigma-YlaC factor YlaD